MISNVEANAGQAVKVSEVNPAVVVIDLTVGFTDPSTPLGADLGERVGEGAVEDDRRCCAVGQDVAELVGDVAVVDVHRGAAGLRRAQHALEVLVPVVEVERDVIVG